MSITRHSTFVFVCLLALCGCRTHYDPSVDLLESELRGMEDHLWLMQDRLQQQCEQLASCRRENHALRAELARTDREPGAPAAERPRSTPRHPSPPDSIPKRPSQPAAPQTPRPAPPATDDPPEDDFDEDLVRPPQVDEGEETVDPAEVMEMKLTPSSEPDGLPSDAPPFPQIEQDQTDSAETNNDADQAEIVPLPDSQSRQDRGQMRVAKIVLNNKLTGGYDADGKPGDEGVLVVIEPRDARGKYVPLAAPISIAVLDPKQSGGGRRIATWKFDTAETTAHLKKSLFGRGIHIELPWPNQPPQQERLVIRAQYETIDGRRLEAQRTIYIAPTATVPLWQPHR